PQFHRSPVLHEADSSEVSSKKPSEKLFPIPGFPLKFTRAKCRVATGHRSERGSGTGQTRIRSAPGDDCRSGVEEGLGGPGAHPGGAIQRIAGTGRTAAE